jgi:hypothetical protein
MYSQDGLSWGQVGGLQFQARISAQSFAQQTVLRKREFVPSRKVELMVVTVAQD